MFGASPNAHPRGDIELSVPLRTSVEEITTAWLSQALGCEVEEVDIVKVINGTSSKILIKLEFPEEDDMSQRLRIRGSFNPSLLAVYPEAKATYRREAGFHYNVAPMTQMHLPPAIYRGAETVSGQGIVIMSDLSGGDYEFGEGKTFGPSRGSSAARRTWPLRTQGHRVKKV
ncbi:hypothetical protein DL770_008376 [Monosporascus sp. CRB-9-2]|nr:hypothetical protein DL770_008376 [Monosporascus sp. CRB-9-2]